MAETKVDYQTVTMRIERKIADQIKKLAKREGRSVSAQIGLWCLEALKADREKQKEERGK